MTNEQEDRMDEQDQLDDTITPDPEDPGEAYGLVDLHTFPDGDEPADPDAEQSPDIEGIDGEDDDE